MSELSAAVAGLRKCGEILITISETLATLSRDDATEQTQPAEPAPTLEEVRAVLARISVDGRTAEVQALIRKHGADKLSQIDPAQYANLMAEAEAL